LGSLVKGEKPKLVVEVSENKVFPIHPCYWQDHARDEIQKPNQSWSCAVERKVL
jgi:G:T-mismatch repair DNA endonuclease (very short patch repair protein)